MVGSIGVHGSLQWPTTKPVRFAISTTGMVKALALLFERSHEPKCVQVAQTPTSPPTKLWTLPRVFAYTLFIAVFVVPAVAIAFLGGFPVGIQRLYDFMSPVWPYLFVSILAVGGLLLILLLIASNSYSPKREK